MSAPQRLPGAPAPARTGGRADFVSSLAHGLRVLTAFTSSQPEWGIGELARALGMDQRRTQRLVSTLYELGYLEQDPVTRRYRPGLAVLDMGFAALESFDVRQVAQPFLRTLLDRFGQSVVLGVRNDLDILIAECLHGERYRIGVRVCIGDRFPIHLSSNGKAILAELPAEELDAVLDRISFDRPLTAYSVPSRAALEQQLRQVRDRGFAVQDQETGLGVRSVSAALTRKNDGQVVGSVNVAMPTPMMSMEALEAEVAPQVVATAQQISDRLTAQNDFTSGRP